MDFLYRIRVVKTSLRHLLAFGFRCLDHLGIHLLELMGFSGNGLLEIFLRRMNSIKGPQVIMSVDRFRLGSSPEEPGDLREPFLVRLGRKSQVFAVCLRFPCKSLS